MPQCGRGVLRETGLSLWLYHVTKSVGVSVSLFIKQEVVSSLWVCSRSNGVPGYIERLWKISFSWSPAHTGALVILWIRSNVNTLYVSGTLYVLDRGDTRCTK